MASKKSRGLLFALVLGVAGFVAGVLTAPKSGKDTRDEVVKDAKKVKASTEETVETVIDKVTDALKRSEQAITSAKEGFKKTPAKKKK